MAIAFLPLGHILLLLQTFHQKANAFRTDWRGGVWHDFALVSFSSEHSHGIERLHLFWKQLFSEQTRINNVLHAPYQHHYCWQKTGRKGSLFCWVAAWRCNKYYICGQLVCCNWHKERLTWHVSITVPHTQQTVPYQVHFIHYSTPVVSVME